mmetsp:Transcript_34533/g.73690  ORF Transcript_34533/g.73690 Transcript_34533/m.73690 type:complete len:236 (+) Transcript_34533:107-814(+)
MRASPPQMLDQPTRHGLICCPVCSGYMSGIFSSLLQKWLAESNSRCSARSALPTEIPHIDSMTWQSRMLSVVPLEATTASRSARMVTRCRCSLLPSFVMMAVPCLAVMATSCKMRSVCESTKTAGKNESARSSSQKSQEQHSRSASSSPLTMSIFSSTHSSDAMSKPPCLTTILRRSADTSFTFRSMTRYCLELPVFILTSWVNFWSHAMSAVRTMVRTLFLRWCSSQENSQVRA